MAVFRLDLPQHKAAQTQNCKGQGLFSLLHDLFDCTKAMAEAGQPGELPLMRELSSLKRVKSLQDPSTGSSGVGGPPIAETPSWKSPVVGSMGRNKEVKANQPSNMHQGRKIKLGNSSIHGRQVPNTRALPSPISDPLHMVDREKAWDLGMEPEEPSISFQMKRKPVVHAQQQKPIINQHDKRFLLQNWRDPSWASDIEASHANSYSSHGMRFPTRQRKSFDLSEPLRSHTRDARAFPCEVSLERLYKSQGSAALRGSKKHPEVLSPLILNSLDDTHHHHGNSLSVFSLEGHHRDRHDQRTNRAVPMGLSKSDMMTPSLQSPHFSKLTSRSQKEAAKSSWKSRHMLASSTSTSQRTVSQSSVSGAWDAASNQLEDELDVCELPRNGCGIPCYWSKSQKRGKSLLDLAERSFPCGFSKPMMHSDSQNYPMGSQDECHEYPRHELVPPLDLEALPLLSDPSAASVGSSTEDSDKLSSDLNGELGVDGGSAARSTNGKARPPAAESKELATNGKARRGKARRSATQSMELATNGKAQPSATKSRELAIYFERPRSLSQKYRPRVFEELIGQNFVAQALSNAIQKRKIAPVYLFQGSRGTGKTSAARILAAALNCLSLEEQRPCRVCKECLAFAAGKCLDIREVDAASNNAVVKVKSLLQTAFSAPSFSQYKVFIIDECHMLTNEAWNALLKLFEEPPRNVVFILITTDPDKLPNTAVSRCQKFAFSKIKESEIVRRLQILAKLENLDVESGALELVASRSDGSLRDAEIILDQLSLLGQNVTISMVHELFGSVSNEKLLGLLDSALTSDTVNTVQRTRQLIDSGVEPLDLMVQLATLVTDVLAGSNELVTKNQKGGFFSNHELSEEEFERLRHALQMLLEAEKQLRAAPTDRTTWLTAALLQLGPARACTMSVSTSCTSASASPGRKTSVGSRQVLKIINGKNHSNTVKCFRSGGPQKKAHSVTTTKGKSRSGKSGFEVQVHPEEASNISSAPLHAKAQTNDTGATVTNERRATLVGPGNLDSIWWNVLEKCKSPPVRQLLQSHGKLMAVSIAADGAMVFLEFDHPEHKSKSERCMKNITSCFQEVLGMAVDVKSNVIKAATSIGARVQAVVDQQAVQLDSHISNSSVAASVRQQHEENMMEVGSLHYWRSQSQKGSPRVTSGQAYSAILTMSKARVVNSDQALRSLDGTPHFGDGLKAFHKTEASVVEGMMFEGTKARVASSIQKAQCKERTEEMMLGRCASLRGPGRTFRGGNSSHDGKVVPNMGFPYDLEEENLRLESQSKYGGLLCWKSPKVEDETSEQGRRGCGILMRLVPCGHSKRRW